EATLGGLLVNINSKYINKDGTTLYNNVLSHEIGHTGGLDHPYEKGDQVELFKGYSFFGGARYRKVPAYNQKKVDLRTNFMSYPQNYIDSKTPAGMKELRKVYNNPGKATGGQIAAIMRYYRRGYLNNDDR